jgi:Conjugative transposon protein TcpC
MSEPRVITRSLRTMRLQAGVIRALALGAVAILSIAGLRSILSPAPAPAVSRPTQAPTLDQGTEAFAEAFARAYLSWTGSDSAQREEALKPFLANGLDSNGGLTPGSASESVQWTDVVGERPYGDQTLVTVAAQTSNGLTYLSVPVARDSHGFMFIASYPAFVGPPATDTTASLPDQPQVSDTSLQTVVARAVTNYLAGNQANLLADLTPRALVSLPPRHLTVTSSQPATWVIPGSRVAIEVSANDARGNSWTFTYELDVQKSDRWYVQSIQVDPTFRGGTE